MTDSGDTRIVFLRENGKNDDFVEISINAESDDDSERSIPNSIDSPSSPREETTLLPPAPNRSPIRTHLLGNSTQRAKDHRAISAPKTKEDRENAGGTVSNGDGLSAPMTMTTTSMTRTLTTTEEPTTSSGVEDEASPTSSHGIQSLFRRIWGWGNEAGDQNSYAADENPRRGIPQRRSSCVHPSGSAVLVEDVQDTDSEWSDISDSDVGRSGTSINHSLIPSQSSAHRDLETGQSTISVACRICQLNDEETEEELERTPCHCKGSLQFAHKSCVRKWISTQRSTTCEICKGQLIDANAASEVQTDEQITPNMMDRLTNRLLMNLGVTTNQLAGDEIEEIRRQVARHVIRTILNAAVCFLTVSIVMTCYVIVMTSHIEVGLPVLCALVLFTIAAKEKLTHLEMNA